MTNEEKHALIANRLEGLPVVQQYASNRWLIQTDGPHYYGKPVPDYSSDLNLCARFEARIRGFAKRHAYLRQIRIRRPREERSPDLWLLSAPASVRVDVAVAMIQSGALDQSATPDAQTSPERDAGAEVGR